MNPGTVSFWLAALAVFVFCDPESAPLRAEEFRAPNVLIVFIDDFGIGDLTCYGGGGVPTPEMDQLAVEGIRFTQFYVAAPICSPSRCGLLTGQFPARWKITSYLQSRAGNRECEQADFLDPAAPSLVRAFHEAGYTTAHVGKWHLGGGRDVSNAPRFAAYGYDIGFGTYESPEPAAALGLKSVPWDPRTEPQQVARHDRTRWMVDETLSIARQNATQPWFINLWLDDTHTPFRASAEQKQRDTGGIGTIEYRAVLRETDRQVGRLLAGLRELGQEQSTLVVLAGDNGPQPSFNRARNNGMRGMKWSLYEGGIRVPMLVRWPGIIPQGVVNNDTVASAVDLFPTLCALAQVSPPENVTFDGEDLSRAFKGERQIRTAPLFWEYGRKPAPEGGTGLRAFPYPTEPDSRSPNVAVRDGDWKLLVNADGSSAELYDLANDRFECVNVAGEHPEITSTLTEKALTWRRSLP